MFTLLSEDCISAVPTRIALYVSLITHLCLCAVLTWLSWTAVPSVRFRLAIVYAGSPEPVREPHLIYTPALRRAPAASEVPADVGKAVHRKTETSAVPQHDAGGVVDYTPTVIPSDLLATLDTDSARQPGLGSAFDNTRSIRLHIPRNEDPLVPPPEPPPGDPDIQPPLVIGGHVEQATLIHQTKPVYPTMAKTARVEGVVVLEGIVNEQGQVENVHVVSGHPMLVDAAVKAVEKWKYRPAKLNGNVIPCPVHIEVRFMLQYSGD